MANNSNPKRWTNWHTFGLLIIVIAIFAIPLQVLDTTSALSKLFNVSVEFEGDLNNSTISKELEREFKNNRCPISGSAKVTKKDGGWEITGGEKIYIIKRAEGGLNIYTPSSANRRKAWFSVMALMTVSIIIAGHGATGRWAGLLIDERNRMSLSRLQMILWTAIILSGLLVAALSNTTLGAKDPLAIALPEELWMLMGISTASLVGSPLILSNKKAQIPETEETQKAIKEAENEEGRVSNIGQIIVNEKPEDARVSNMFKGEETGNATQLDLGKVQMFYFTLILALTYAVALGDVLTGVEKISEFPVLSSSMVALMLISHAGYLTNKAIPHSQKG